MEKFKENRVAEISTNIGLCMFIGWIIGMGIGIFYHPFLWSIFLLPVALIVIVIALFFSTRNKYTSEFLEYMRARIDSAVTLEEIKGVSREFESLAIEDGMYILSYPQDLKDIHRDINSRISILKKQ
jgi:predicted membrane chloride channel (bestrophin family)